MRERSDVAGEPSVTGEVSAAGEAKSPRIDLSVPQVAGSAVAAVLGAQLASSFGVYGTIIGAGVMSIVATCGGTLFQHFFKRTGEQLREVTVAPVRASTGRSREHAPPAPGEFGEGTVYRGRAHGVRRLWKRTVVAAALVFGVTMAGITAYELASGQSLSGAPSTTVGNAVTGQHTSGSGGFGGSDDRHSGDLDDSGTSNDPGTSDGFEDSGGDGPAPAPSATPQDGGAATGSGGGTPDGGDAQDGGDTPAGIPDDTGDQGSGAPASPEQDLPATTPEPSADSRSGSDVQDQGGSAAP